MKGNICLVTSQMIRIKTLFINELEQVGGKSSNTIHSVQLNLFAYERCVITNEREIKQFRFRD